MSCECAPCRQHYRTLGVAYGIPTEAEIEEAYREAVKQWHPDLYENYASLRADAEERFKQIQVAYRELKVHNGGAPESPAESFIAKPQSTTQSTTWSAPVSSYERPPERPPERMPSDSLPISFGSAPGCQTAPNFTAPVKEIIERHLGKLGSAQAIVDLSGNYSQFLLLATLGIMVRDSRGIISLLWYKDLGEINLLDRRRDGKLSAWQKLTGNQQNLTLQISRIDGKEFSSISSQADDSVKQIIYDFLVQKKLQTLR
jgi:hypothetical protein